MTTEDIQAKIREHLPIKEAEKNKNGEVFTPQPPIEEMLNKLPDDVWQNPKLKWLDPANGVGNFPMLVFQKLNEGLKNVRGYKTDKKRKQHIIKNMLYMVELNPVNVAVSKKIFGADANIYCGSFLEDGWKDAFGVDFFDVIIGNPPYNKGGVRSHTIKKKQLPQGVKSETIWPKFIEKSFKLLKPDGFLAFITPLCWLKKSHSLHINILEKHIVWLKLCDDSQSKGMINAEIPISLYVLQNTPNTTNKTTEIISEIQRKKLTTTSTEYLNPAYCIPLAFHSIFNKLIKFIEKHNCSLEYKTKTIKSSGTRAEIPTEYTLEDMWAVDTYRLKEGILVKKATQQHPDADKRKLIIANKASFKGAFIDDGKLSLTGNHKFYILGDNLELIKKILGFKISSVVGEYTKYHMAFLDDEAFTYIPDLRKMGIQDITEDEFYKMVMTEN